MREHLRHRLDLAFEELGALNLKNISRPVEAFVLRLDAVASPPKSNERLLVRGNHEVLPLPDRSSLVVLPNRALTLSILGTAGLQSLVSLAPVTRRLLGLAAFDVFDLAVITACAVCPFLTVEMLIKTQGNELQPQSASESPEYSTVS